MPLASKKSRAAKCTRRNANATFAQPAPRAASPGVSEYVPSDSDSGSSGVDPELEGGDELCIQGRNAVGASVEVLQRLYSGVLPPHLQVRPEENKRMNRRKMGNRKAVYSGDSRTTIWQRESALKNAANGCMTLDAFIVRKVCYLNVKQWRGEQGTHSSLEATA
jgi:hypothetical protein